ncbi:hypothetical protein GGS23DRAFT_590736 [Durotheca rogersii]|uniref:uncharacterized protein n=1 Tax=Durotheca rogersii TaxID=419775 RepID=UPI0022201EA4|nr:uncharacterized protein GGS23DRAFT_590736 [Durotheca rogersii]KAI5854089.1 hypothetical protein GGS23DRAFT_590736 [Durotheca rogersii]
MDRLLSLESIRSVVQSSLPHVAVESISLLPPDRLLRSFSIKISDDRVLLLSLPPPRTQRILRSEQAAILSEYLATKWILEEVLKPTHQVEATPREATEIQSQADHPSGPREREANVGEMRNSTGNILRYLPILITHSSLTTELGVPFNLFEPTRGVPISGLTTPLTRAERGAIDFQQGMLLRQLLALTSPNGRFGLATAVVGPLETAAELPGTRQTPLGCRGASTWRNAFHSLLEGVLRDAEDMAVTISYEPIRAHFNRISHVLDGVTTARLVVLDASNEANVLLSRSTKSAKDGDGTNPRSALGPVSKKSETETEAATKEQTGTHEEKRESQGEDLPRHQAPTITVTGLRDWSNCIFGDPLMAEVFSLGPTPEFLRGFNQRRDGSLSSSASGPVVWSSTADVPGQESVGEGESLPYDGDVIEDRENARARLLLYECYHATVHVVEQFYRPGRNSSEREIAARRRLTAVLAKLEDFDEMTGDKRARRPSGAPTWPVKKVKADLSKDADTRVGTESPDPEGKRTSGHGSIDLD